MLKDLVSVQILNEPTEPINNNDSCDVFPGVEASMLPREVIESRYELNSSTWPFTLMIEFSFNNCFKLSALS